GPPSFCWLTARIVGCVMPTHASAEFAVSRRRRRRSGIRGQLALAAAQPPPPQAQPPHPRAGSGSGTAAAALLPSTPPPYTSPRTATTPMTVAMTAPVTVGIANAASPEATPSAPAPIVGSAATRLPTAKASSLRRVAAVRKPAPVSRDNLPRQPRTPPMPTSTPATSGINASTSCTGRGYAHQAEGRALAGARDEARHLRTPRQRRPARYFC